MASGDSLDKSTSIAGPNPFPGGSKSPINFKQPRVMDFRSSPGLAAGIKRVGGRSGVSRLGKSPISAESKHGKLRISHKY